ncbi:granulocyte-macrophage colony-stimulating factor receptor subunit alpha isoform X4 [Camelus bactrianus]|uniref:Granulocyte-macrophage colony-stimulating factor receptor subunit alpha isoform X4 n=1 Tax=Camelus bactrianus TaxID=9837 RepID=A0AC58Q1F4_CAMBA
MAVLLAFISLLLVPLNPACFTDPAQEKVSPIINLKLGSRKKMLTWNSRRNVTWQECTIDAPLDPPISQTPQVAEDGTYFCTFSNSVLHRGATLTVNVTSEGHEFKATLTFCNSGREGSGAVNFSCLIYNVRFLNCSWAQGPAAPADVRYHLYMWASLHGNVSECAQYVLDPTGTRVGCHFDQLGEPQTTDNYFFLVNGTSNETDIQFLDFTPFVATEIEKYNPPANLTARNNGSYYVIQWDNPVTRFNISSHVLYYELDIQRKGSFSKTDPSLCRWDDVKDLRGGPPGGGGPASKDSVLRRDRGGGTHRGKATWRRRQRREGGGHQPRDGRLEPPEAGRGRRDPPLEPQEGARPSASIYWGPAGLTCFQMYTSWDTGVHSPAVDGAVAAV